MKQLLPLLFICLVLIACETQKYIGATNFYTLHQGMSEQDFLDWKKRDYSYIGGRPVNTKMFNYDGSVWKVFVFNVYANNGGACFVDHQEYVAFKNGYLVEYGTGELPLTLRQNPNSYQYDIHNH